MFDFILNLRYLIEDCISYVKEQYDHFRFKLKPEDLSEIYNLLSDALEKPGINLQSVLIGIAQARELQGSKKAFIAYSTIAGDVRNPSTKTPISDAFRPFIPRSDYSAMRRAELAQQLSKTLKYIQLESDARAKIDSLLRNTRLQIFAWFGLPVLVIYPNIDFFMPFIYRTYGVDEFDSFYRFWHAVDQGASYFILFCLVAFAAYITFYLLYRDSYGTESRVLCDNLPFFKGYKEANAFSTLINVTIAIKNSSGTPITQTIKDQIAHSSQYVSTFLEQLAIDVGRSELRGGISANPLFPKKLRGILALRLAIPSSDNDLLAPVEAAIKKHLITQENISNITIKIVKYLNFGVIFIPALAGAIKSMSDTPFT